MLFRSCVTLLCFWLLKKKQVSPIVLIAVSYTHLDVYKRQGLISLANGGVLFLDEVHCLKAECQEKLFQFMDKMCIRDSSSVANADKPLVWYNRQPSNSSTGELDKDALNFNKDTYYVGFDANQGAELQGQMIKEYIEKNIDTLDRNGDGVIGYVLAIGDVGHNDSIARTRGCLLYTSRCV